LRQMAALTFQTTPFIIPTLIDHVFFF